MKIGFIGLGKMGLNMIKRLMERNHQVVVFDINEEAVKAAVQLGAQGARDLGDLTSQLDGKKVVWVMVPSGDITEETIFALAPHLQKGDIIVDGGNSNYRDTIERSKRLEEKSITLIDAGTSGGVWGLQLGYCIMAGGEKSAFQFIEPVIRSLAPENGYSHVGPSGSGHFVKMVHNGIEYAMLQSYAEGFEILEAKKEFNLDLKEISNLWRNGSVIRSWLLDLAASAFEKDAKLSSLKPFVNDSGEGRWTVNAAIDLDVPAPVITQSLFERFRSRQDNSFGNRFIAALRNEFGGHEVKKN